MTSQAVQRGQNRPLGKRNQKSKKEHPKATFVEIEGEVHKRMMELEAQVLQDAAQASESREWGSMSGKPAPLCPTCAIPLQARGKHQRTLQISLGRGSPRNS